MSFLQEFGFSCVHWSLGLTVLAGLVASEFSGAITIIALPIALVSITLSALCAASINANENTYKKRRLCDILEFFKIWIKILELLVASATCARLASATVDYISNERLRDWFLGLQSHSLGEPWPDVLGVSVIIVVTGLFMLGLERSVLFSGFLFLVLLGTFTFFTAVGLPHITLTFAKWAEDFKTCSLQSVLAAAAMSSYGFTNTMPRVTKFKAFKFMVVVLLPLVLYSVVILVFTLMSHYKEFSDTATPLVRVFELRDIDWARLVMSICIICIVCLALTEALPSSFVLFEKLASKEWQIFLSSLQYRNSLTGAPLLAIFAAGSLSAILAFACPLLYLVRILNATTLLKSIIQCLHILYCFYRPEFKNDGYLIGTTNTHYSKLKQSTKQKESQSCFKNKISKLCCCRKKANLTSVNASRSKSINAKSTQDDEYLLLNDYCDKSIDVALNDESSDDNDEKESVVSSDVDESNSSTDVDAVVEEYREKIQVATIDNFNENKYPTYVTATTVIIFLSIIAIATISLSQVIVWKLYNLIWPCFTVLFFSTVIILVMPTNTYTPSSAILPKYITPACSLVSMQCDIILVTFVLHEIWPGLLFWICVGCLLFWRCDCCTCDGLLITNNQKSKLKITENIAEYSDKYVDTILIAR